MTNFGNMELDDAHLQRLREIAEFEDRISNAYERLPYLEEIVDEGETEVAEKVQEVFETYQESLLVLLRPMLARGSYSSLTNEVVDEAYNKLFEAEGKLYRDVVDFLIEDLNGRYKRSHAKPSKAYEDIRSVKKSAFDLGRCGFGDVTAMSAEYSKLLDRMDGIEAMLTSKESETESVRRWQLATVLLSAIAVALATKLMGLW
jgi:hypothetical protein